MAQFPFVGPSHSTRVKRLDAQRTINLYPELASPTSKNVSALIGTPGLRPWISLAGGNVRGLLRFDANTLIVVVGFNVWRVDPAGTSTLLGTVNASTKRVSMETNGTNIFMVTGGAGSPAFVITPTSVTPFMNVNFAGADRVGFLDGRYVFNQSDTQKFQWMELYSTNLSGLNIASADGAPDKLVSLIVDHRELWLPGEKSTEVYFNAGDPDNPFERINGAYLETGCVAYDSLAKLDNATYWLSADDRGTGMVVRAEGYVPRRVSDHAVEHAIAGYSRIDDAFAYTYQQEGHSFYVLTFPTADATWVYDAASNMWHERGWFDIANNVIRRHRSNCHAVFAGRHVVGDFENGNLYFLDLDYYRDNTDLIKRVRTAPHLSDMDYAWQVYDNLILDMTVGVGNTEVPNPQLMLEWSKDGGYTWSNVHTTEIGRIGERAARAEWRRLGRSRDRVFRVSITDPVRVEFIGASITVRRGNT